MLMCNNCGRGIKYPSERAFYIVKTPKYATLYLVICKHCLPKINISSFVGSTLEIGEIINAENWD